MGRLRSILDTLGSGGRRAGQPAVPGRTAAPAGGAGAGAGADAAADADPAVSYAPDRDGDPDPGEVVWAWVPYEDDPTHGKDRPVLVIGYDTAASTDLLLAVPLSSKDPARKRDADEWVEVGAGGWDDQRRPSFANADRVLRYGPADVRREGAALPRATFDAVVAKVRELGGLG
jgi:mRNA-degrading endonuclease toxin of MazEF toxin-antitoxin module